MKKITIIYWISTVIAAGLMIYSAIPDVVLDKKTVEFMNGFMHYPDYFTRFIGVAKLLGSVAILIPVFSKWKEWAYAGLFFDLVGATYSMIMLGVPAWGPEGGWLLMFAWFIPLAVSYIYYHKKFNPAPVR